jgi:hypothetical protein
MFTSKKIFLFILILLTINANAQRACVSLAGEWGFKIDSANIGEKDVWYNKPSSFFDQKITLPGTMDDAGYGMPVNVKSETNNHQINKEVLLHLWRKVSYVGPAWYQKQVKIPAGWKNKNIELLLERVIWETKVWVDGKEINNIGESLIAPQTFDLSTFLTPGKHTITLRIDNSKKYDISLGARDFAHIYTNETQIIWNGVIGKIGLEAKSKTFFTNVQIFDANANARYINIKALFSNQTEKIAKSKIEFSIEKAGIIYGSLNTTVSLEGGTNELNFKIDISKPIKNWDEFNPSLYNLKSKIISDKNYDINDCSFGFRNISNEDAHLRINTRILFLRGTLECDIFPKIAHTPMEKEAWLKVLRIAKSYGLNHLRFHSWCPPKAAFQAADEMGFYLQIELPVWSLKIGQGKAADDFLKREAERIISNYGNHPSFCFWSMGNEMQGNMQWLSDEVNMLKVQDKRRLYTTTTFTFEEGYGKWPAAADDYFVTQYTKKGWVRGQGIFDTDSPSFNKDYSAAVDSLPVPLITHEVGQYAVYPNMAEIPKYTGVLTPKNFIAIKNDLLRKKLLPLAKDYTRASGKLAVLLYKEEIERALKTKVVSGFQLLDLHDFPGQGTALVGILDAFWESKGLVTAQDFRKFCSPVVPLIRYPKAVYTNDEIFTASVEVANFSSSSINHPLVNWHVFNDKNSVVASGKLNPGKIEIGNGVSIGELKFPLNKIYAAEKLTIKVSIENTSFNNEWNIWVYPNINRQPEHNIFFTTDYSEAINALNEGKKVLFNPGKEKINGVEGKFVQVFWSPVHFPDQSGTMGLLINKDHPAFKDFPTDSYTNWQWWDLCKNSTTLVLDSAGINPSTIVLRNIDNFFKNRNMASMIEGKVGMGRLLFCTMDIHSDMENRPVARQLKFSLLNYMRSKSFSPATELATKQLKQLIK